VAGEGVEGAANSAEGGRSLDTKVVSSGGVPSIAFVGGTEPRERHGGGSGHAATIHQAFSPDQVPSLKGFNWARLAAP
jgi:hypothetical protein